ncbi:hypothetical protein [Taibaiella helva]|uniref:hypothetical protein n=1 Tax=Taibaiella helva TaxID=2301235 RepID=UPI000E57FC82|nr:hypothetical protein [Taibaiella helva]
MSVGAKHIATFLLGAAAGAAALKYASMSEEEREKLMASLKEKAEKVKGEAEDTFEKAKDYFSELTTKGGESLKEHWADAESFLKDLFRGKEEQGGGEKANPA